MLPDFVKTTTTWSNFPIRTSTATRLLDDWLPQPLQKATTSRSHRRSWANKPTRDLKHLVSQLEVGDCSELTRAELISLLTEEDVKRKSWVEGQCFEFFFLIVVIANTAFIGYQIDHPVSLRLHQFMMVNLLFLSLFVTEIVLKVAVLGWRQYMADYWNVFDFIVTLLVAVQMTLTFLILHDHFFGHLDEYVAADCLQILRLCRLFRLARIFPELGHLIRSFFMSIQALFWIFVLLLLWFYISACFATIFIGRRAMLPSEDHVEVGELRQKFATIPLSMFALFEIMTLEGWVDYVRPLLHTRVHLVCFFLLFIFVTAFFILNLITAVIVDRTKAAQDEDREWEKQEAQLHRKAHINCICNALYQENRSSNVPDVITREDFDSTIQEHEEVQQALGELGWSTRYLSSMFSCVDQNNEGIMSISSLHKLLEISDQPLNTANYMRFQLSLAHRLEHQEKLTLKVLRTLERLDERGRGGEASATT
eukprot:CAMPEP_0171110136 /NCGR_PEP_ID=MMETSP0766_2-20121228/71182_1 /TAXON_ID=439317 /ORGANISM="Gambierdiscus australes, Strain CAWD 149" /LENGTH=480 /DNA_ID=CAMNT_0011571973 /DNA_START=19 /DNA_END=1461 /DNA_ORIENTATION=-